MGAVMAATAATGGWAVASPVRWWPSNTSTAWDGPRHLLFSVSKSLVAAVVGALHGARGDRLDAPCGVRAATTGLRLRRCDGAPPAGCDQVSPSRRTTTRPPRFDARAGDQWAPKRGRTCRHAARPADLAVEVGARRARSNIARVEPTSSAGSARPRPDGRCPGRCRNYCGRIRGPVRCHHRPGRLTGAAGTGIIRRRHQPV